MQCAHPCPWSRSGSAQGLFTEGRTLIHVIGSLKVCRPAVACLENVASIVEHKHFTLVEKLFFSAGYIMVWQQCVNSGHWLPSQRNRWLCILIDTYCLPCILPVPAIEMSPLQPVTVGTFHAFFEALPPSLMNELLIGDQALKVYGDPNYAKSIPGTSPFTHPRHILRCRTLRGDSKALTFMAAYGEQHALPPNILKKQGLHAHCCRGSQVPHDCTP